jgi:hypothetical protein
MDRNAIMATIKSLAASQGMYSRLYANLVELEKTDYDAYDELMLDWEERNFKDSLDFILYLET